MSVLQKILEENHAFPVKELLIQILLQTTVMLNMHLENSIIVKLKTVFIV